MAGAKQACHVLQSQVNHKSSNHANRGLSHAYHVQATHGSYPLTAGLAQMIFRCLSAPMAFVAIVLAWWWALLYLLAW